MVQDWPTPKTALAGHARIVRRALALGSLWTLHNSTAFAHWWLSRSQYEYTLVLPSCFFLLDCPFGGGVFWPQQSNITIISRFTELAVIPGSYFEGYWRSSRGTSKWFTWMVDLSSTDSRTAPEWCTEQYCTRFCIAFCIIFCNILLLPSVAPGFATQFCTEYCTAFWNGIIYFNCT